MNRSLQVARLLLPIALLATGAGYVAPWVNHNAAGLVITGLDMGEIVKFLPVVRHAQVTLWREGFYLPLLALSLACSLYAFRPTLSYTWPIRWVLLALSAAAIGNFLPPAWTPSLLLTPEFRLQTLAIGLCALALATSPLLGRLPARIAAILLTPLLLAAMWLPTQAFLRVLPNIAELYHRPLRPAWGLYTMLAGLLALLIASWLAAHMREKAPNLQHRI